MLQLTPIKIETYGNSSDVEIIGKFQMFLRWKDKVYRLLFYVTNVNNSPNLLSRDACYILGVLGPCYSVQVELSNSSTDSTDTQVTPIHSTQVGKSFLHSQNEGTLMDLTKCSKKHSIPKDQLQGCPLTKQSILDVYSDMFTGIGKLPGEPYKFQLKPNPKPT